MYLQRVLVKPIQAQQKALIDMLLDVRSEARARAISITPLIDVVFILLLFFMLSSTFSHFHQIEVKASAAGRTPSVPTEVKRLLLSKGHVLVDGVALALESPGLISRLEDIRELNTKVIIAATPEVEVQKLISLVDQVRRLGIVDISVGESVGGQ